MDRRKMNILGAKRIELLDTKIEEDGNQDPKAIESWF